MLFSSRQPTAEQEALAGIALTALFADPAAFSRQLTSAGRRFSGAHVVEIASEDQVGNIGNTKAFGDMRTQFMAAHPQVVDMKPVTIKHPAIRGFTSHAGVAIYVKEPTVPRQASVWFFDLMS